MAELLSVSEAAKVVDIPERTFRRWVSTGRIASEPDPLGVRGRVLNADVVLNFKELLNGGHCPATDRPESGQRPPAPATDPPMAGQQSADGENFCNCRQPAGENGNNCFQTSPAELQALRDRIDAQEEYISHLQTQLDLRAREIERHAVAEEQLRVMLMRLEQTNAELASTLVQKALPPAEVTTTVVKTRRTRWWKLWR